MNIKSIFIWTVVTAISIYFGGFLLTIYNSHQRSPDHDPVTFNLSDGELDASLYYTFYIPSRYWVDFPSDYKLNRNSYLTFVTYINDLNGKNPGKSIDRVFVHISRTPGSGARLKIYEEKIKSILPDQEILNVSVFNKNTNSKTNEEEIYKFTGFDSRNVIIVIRPDSESMTIHRELDSNIEIEFICNTRKIADFFRVDEELTAYVRSLRTSPFVFTKLK